MSPDQLSAWTSLSTHLSSGANIYLYGCNVADGSGEGQRLLDSLAELTGADVFASDDVTGQGGDWVLEAASSGDQSELEAGLNTHLDAAGVALYADALADYNETAWSGTQTYTDGAISFTLGLTGGGTIDWAYDGTTDTLSISDSIATTAATSLTITDNNGGLIVDSVTLDTDLGSLVSDVDINSITVSGGFFVTIDTITIGGGGGTIGTLEYADRIFTSATLVINANITTFNSAQFRSIDVTVNGDVGSISIDPGAGPGGSLWDSTIHVTGDLGSIYVENAYTGASTLTVDNVCGQFDITGAYTYSNSFSSPTLFNPVHLPDQRSARDHGRYHRYGHRGCGRGGHGHADGDGSRRCEWIPGGRGTGRDLRHRHDRCFGQLELYAR